MPAPPKPPPEILSIWSRWSEKVASFNTKQEPIVFFQNELPGLLLNRQLFTQILDQITKGGTHPELRQAMMFENEYLLFLQIENSGSLTGVEPSRRYHTAGQMCLYQIHWLMQFNIGETHETHV